MDLSVERPSHQNTPQSLASEWITQIKMSPNNATPSCKNAREQREGRECEERECQRTTQPRKSLCTSTCPHPTIRVNLKVFDSMLSTLRVQWQQLLHRKRPPISATSVNAVHTSTKSHRQTSRSYRDSYCLGVKQGVLNPVEVYLFGFVR
jgi:hypothetical protein